MKRPENQPATSWENRTYLDISGTAVVAGCYLSAGYVGIG